MTIRDLLNADIEIQGHVIIKEYTDNAEPRIHYGGYNLYRAGEYLDMTISYIYPDDTEPDTIIIEVKN